MFIEEGEGDQIATKIMDLRTAFLSLVAEEDRAELEDRIPVKEDYTTAPSYSDKSWSEFNFFFMPVAAIYPMLRKYQNDIKTMESEILEYLEKK